MSLSLRHKHIPSGGVSNSSKSEGQTSEKKEKAASSRLVDEAKVHGFETELISLEKMLHQRQSSDQFKAIGVVGKRGVGKTTLCQVLFNKKEPVQANFLPRIWVCMSWKPNEYKDDHKATIVRRMLTYLGVENNIIDSVYEDRSLSGLLYALHLQLTGKKYLIVLDDAKETEEWFANLDSPITEKEKWGERLAFGLPKGHGGTVIVTSRDEKLAKMMVGEKNLLHLLPLSHPKSCSSIFNDHMKKGQKLENDTEQKEFLKKCAGLPLAATMMGKIKSEELEKAAEKAAKEAAEAAEKAAEKAAKEAAEKAAKEAAEKAAKEAAEKAAEKAAKEAAEAAEKAAEKAAKEAAEKAAEKAAKEAAEKAAEKAAKEAAEKAAKEPESPISSKDGEKNKTEELPTEPKPIQPDEAAKSSKDDKKIKSVEVPAGEEPTQQQEKDARSSSKDDEPIKSEEHPAEAEPRPHQEGAAHNETHEEAASGTN